MYLACKYASSKLVFTNKSLGINQTGHIKAFGQHVQLLQLTRNLLEMSVSADQNQSHTQCLAGCHSCMADEFDEKRPREQRLFCQAKQSVSLWKSFTPEGPMAQCYRRSPVLTLPYHHFHWWGQHSEVLSPRSCFLQRVLAQMHFVSSLGH